MVAAASLLAMEDILAMNIPNATLLLTTSIYSLVVQLYICVVLASSVEGVPKKRGSPRSFAIGEDDFNFGVDFNAMQTITQQIYVYQLERECQQRFFISPQLAPRQKHRRAELPMLRRAPPRSPRPAWP